MEFEIRDPFAGHLTVEGESLNEAIASAYSDIPADERPAYVWHQGRRIRVPGGVCRPVQ